MRKLIVFALAALIASGGIARADWQNAGPGELGLNKTTGGGLMGAALGGLLGSQIGRGDGKVAATAIGVLGGALFGSQIGKSLDQADRMAMASATERSLARAPIGRQVAWRNPDTGHHGTVTPKRNYRLASGQYCREYQQTIVIDGQQEEGYGKACRQPDGNWRIAN